MAHRTTPPKGPGPERRTASGRGAPDPAKGERVYEAPTINEALLQAKIELGEDAVIIDSGMVERTAPATLLNRLVSGIIGRKAERVARVLARPGGDLYHVPIESPRPAAPPPPPPAAAPRPALDAARYSLPAAEPALARPECSPAPRAAAAVSGAAARAERDTDKIIHTLLGAVDEMNKKIAELEGRMRGGPAPAPRLHPNLEKLRRILERNELCPKVSGELVDHLATLAPHVREDWERVKESAVAWLIQRVNVGGAIDLEAAPGAEPVVVAFVGPPGEGKTTTIAKLAAHFTFQQRKKVGLITLDTFKVAAIDHLKTYAEIIGVPMRPIYKLDAILGSLDEFRSKDLVIIDTAGVSQNSRIELMDLKGRLAGRSEIRVFLTFSATTNFSDMRGILENFRNVGVDRLVVTKTDATTVYGPLVNLAIHGGVPIAYVTNGQNIPDDVKVADPVDLVRHMIENA